MAVKFLPMKVSGEIGKNFTVVKIYPPYSSIRQYMNSGLNGDKKHVYNCIIHLLG